MSKTPNASNASAKPAAAAAQGGLPEGLKPTQLDRLKEVWRGLTLSQRVAGIVTTLLTFGGLLWIALSASQGDYQTLYSGLSAEQSSQITQALKASQIPYELDSDSTIKVPSEMVHEARVQLAGQGLPNAVGGAGFELFDKNEFGMTAFTQKVNYQRAMEAELGRTISHLDVIRQARVHLVIPERSLFKDDQRSPTASVILGLDPGRELDPASIRAIRHLVASGVEGLDARDITLVNESGDLLAAPRQQGAAGMLGGGGDGEHIRVAQNMERQLEERVLALLTPLVGPNGARVEASVELDHRVVSETSESFDPEKSAVRREQRSEELSQVGQAEAGGLVGAAAQLDGQQGGANAANNNQSSRSNEATEYEIDKTVRQVTDTTPRLARLSVAVLLDESVLAPPAKEGEPPIAAPDLEKLSALVAGAVGLNESRGDRLELSMQRFQPIEAHSLEPIPFYQEPAFVQSSIRHGLMALVALLLIFFVLRPMSSSFLAALKSSDKQGEAAQLAEAPAQSPKRMLQEPEIVGRSVAEIIDEVEKDGVTLELSSVDPVQEHQKRLRAEVLELTATDLDRASQVVSQWLRMDTELDRHNQDV